MLHGMGLNAHSFDPVALALGDLRGGAPTLSVDLPGHGRSDWREDADYTPGPLAADLSRALERLAPQPFALVGHSLGGLAAILLAAERPERVRGVALVDITPGVRPKRDAGAVVEFITGQRDFATHEEIVDRAIAFGIGHDRAALRRGIALNTRRRSDGRWEWAHHLAHLETPPIAASDDPAPLRPLWAPLEALHAAGAPLALIAAEGGLVDAALRAEWGERLPGSTVVTVDGPHNLHEAAPRELAAALGGLAFVTRG
nr:alpha/beta hydrolase [Leucobacter weissii]